jgi:hypothetical protein
MAALPDPWPLPESLDGHHDPNEGNSPVRRLIKAAEVQLNFSQFQPGGVPLLQ